VGRRGIYSFNHACDGSQPSRLKTILLYHQSIGIAIACLNDRPFGVGGVTAVKPSDVGVYAFPAG